MKNKILGMEKGPAFLITAEINLLAGVLFMIKERWTLVGLFMIMATLSIYMALGGWIERK